MCCATALCSDWAAVPMSERDDPQGWIVWFPSPRTAVRDSPKAPLFHTMRTYEGTINFEVSLRCVKCWFYSETSSTSAGGEMNLFWGMPVKHVVLWGVCCTMYLSVFCILSLQLYLSVEQYAPFHSSQLGPCLFICLVKPFFLHLVK